MKGVQQRLFVVEEDDDEEENGDVIEALRRLDFEERNVCAWCGRLVGVHRLKAPHPVDAKYGKICDECVAEASELQVEVVICGGDDGRNARS